MSSIYVLYHAHCTDGTGSKYAAWKRFGDTAEYIPVSYGDPMPKMKSGSKIYILDFSYPKDVLEQLQRVHNSVVVLDHHKTAEEDLRGVPGCTFDMNRSGCVISWQYFHPESPVPDLLLDIQDRDLWQFKRPNSKAVHVGLRLYKNEMGRWDSSATSSTIYGLLVEQGNCLLEAQQIDVENSVNNKVKVINFMGHRCGIINTSEHQSEIGSGICESKKLNVDFGICYSIKNNNDVLLSLRSVGDFDVSEIARKLGGGGHKCSSGAKVNIDQLHSFLR